MPGLLDLPNEILHEIIDNVLSGGQIDIPPSLVRRRASEWKSNDIPVAYIQNHAVHSSNALGLLTCRAIHRQTSHLIKNSPCVYKMNLAMVDETWYYPTWTQIPLRQGAEPGIVDKLEIQIIPCRTNENDLGISKTFKSTYRLEDTLNSIIERFLAVGVDGGFGLSPDGVAHAKQTFPRNLRVQTIEIDIARTDTADVNTPISHETIPIRPVEGFVHAEHDVLYPVPLETAIAMHEIFFWRLMVQLAWRYNLRSFLERVGKFRIYEYDGPEGKRVFDLDIDDFLARDLPHPNPGEPEERAQIRQRRKELGMWDGVPKENTAEAEK